MARCARVYSRALVHYWDRCRDGLGQRQLGVVLVKPVILLGGLPASGKTWVCEQLPQMRYVRNDDYMKAVQRLIATIRTQAQTKPVITDCPFGISERRKMLQAEGLQVKPYFIYETPTVLWRRYQTRAHKPLKFEYFDYRAPLIKERAQEWKAPIGTSSEILALLKREAANSDVPKV